MARRVGLGLLVGAVLHLPLHAQDTTRVRRDSLKTAADSARADSIAKARHVADSVKAVADSIRADSVAKVRRMIEDLKIIADAKARADSIKAPLARAESPIVADVAVPRDYDRSTLFSSGAAHVGELLDRVPGVTVFRSGWLGSPTVGAQMGEFGRVRVFYDGIEVDALDPRTGGVMDLSALDSWPLEGARIERGANETRVYLRSWRARSTTPETRVDIGTGDLETNIYRGYFARRFGRGQALQLGAQQLSTRDVRNAGDADQLSLFGRIGFARRQWSVDGQFSRLSRDRAEQLAVEPFVNLHKLDARYDLSYLRIGYGDPDRSRFWGQTTASSQVFTKRGDPPQVTLDTIPGPGGGGPGGSKTDPDTIKTSTDTSVTHSQYVAAFGANAGPLRLSVTARLRDIAGEKKVSESARLAYDRQRVAASVFAERSPYDGILRTEVAGRVMPFSFLALGGAVSRYSATGDSTRPTTLAFRGEAGLRLGRLWVAGGIMSRDTASLIAPVVFDTSYVGAAQGKSTGYFASLNGKFWKDVGLDVFGVRYDGASAFRPQYQTRAELYLNTSWPGRFPSGHLNILFAVFHEYRSDALFFVLDKDQKPVSVHSSQYRTLGGQLEIRLLQATLSYQYRNYLAEQYEQVPGFPMPRQTQFYGVRWYFFN